MKPEAITERIRAALPDAVVELTDLTGTEDHWQATVISSAFTGKSLIERAKECDLPIAAYVRQVLRGDTPSARRPQAHAALVALSRVGNNLNQLTRLAHGGTLIPRDLYRAIEAIQAEGVDVGVADTQLDQAAVSGVGHVADLADADAAKLRVDRVWPAQCGGTVVHLAPVSYAWLRTWRRRVRARAAARRE